MRQYSVYSSFSKCTSPLLSQPFIYIYMFFVLSLILFSIYLLNSLSRLYFSRYINPTSNSASFLLPFLYFLFSYVNIIFIFVQNPLLYEYKSLRTIILFKNIYGSTLVGSRQFYIYALNIYLFFPLWSRVQPIYVVLNDALFLRMHYLYI